MIKVEIYGGRFILVPIESYTTSEACRDYILESLKIPYSKWHYFCLHEHVNKTESIEERFLDLKENLADLKTQWAIDKEDIIKNQKLSEDEIFKIASGFKLFLRVQIYFPYEVDDYDSLTIHFFQVNCSLSVPLT